MKNKFILSALPMLLSIFFTPSLQAQDSSPARFGIKGGVNFSSLYTQDDAENDKIRTGFTIGLFSKMPLNSVLAVQPELNYSTKGSEVTYNNAFVNGTASFNVNYLELPILLVVNLGKNFNVHIGPYAAVLISGKTTNKSNVDLFNFEDNINVDDFNRLDAGFAAGLGIDLGPLSLGARYTYGLLRVGKERDYLGTTYVFPDAVNGVASLYASISLK
jgi:opacity protein-like surface antigen